MSEPTDREEIVTTHRPSNVDPVKVIERLEQDVAHAWRHVSEAESERDEARATIERVKALIPAWRSWKESYPPDSIEGYRLVARQACAKELLAAIEERL